MVLVEVDDGDLKLIVRRTIGGGKTRVERKAVKEAGGHWKLYAPDDSGHEKLVTTIVGAGTDAVLRYMTTGKLGVV